jgi:hypothetical protein
MKKDTTIKAGDLLKVTTSDGEVGVGFAYHSVEGIPDSDLLIDISWRTGGSTECVDLNEVEMEFEKISF